MVATAAQDDNDTPARRAALGTLLSLLLRILSFACTQWTLRVIDPAALGQASIQLELMLTTILFVSREGFRLALTRVQWKESNIVNASWLSIPVVSVIASLALIRHLSLLQSVNNDDPNNSDDYRLAGMLYCAAAVVEGLAEPAILVCLNQFQVTIRVTAEAIATLGKTLTLVLCLAQPSIAQRWSVSSFGISQLVYGTIIFVVMYTKTWSILTWPSFQKSSPSSTRWWLQSWLDGNTCWLVVVFTVQGLFKHALTEGDKIVLTQLEDAYHQGVYSMGLHFGGMAARILLQPMEENARLLWSRQAATTQSKQQNGSDPLEQSFTVLVKLVMYIGFVFAAIAVHYTSVLLKVLAGPKWGDNGEATQVLSAFCVYTAFLAVNGMTEAFVYGVAESGKQVGGLSMAHLVVGLVFYGIAPVFVTRLGTVGLVAANCIAMLLRCVYSLSFATKFFAERRDRKESNLEVAWRLLKQIVPHTAVLVAFGLAFAVTRISLDQLQLAEKDIDQVGLSKVWLLAASKHVVVGIACGMAVLLTAFVFEGDFGRSLRSMLRRKQD